jgi:rRNA processing protein Krr1/Pno1
MSAAADVTTRSAELCISFSNNGYCRYGDKCHRVHDHTIRQAKLNRKTRKNLKSDNQGHPAVHHRIDPTQKSSLSNDQHQHPQPYMTKTGPSSHGDAPAQPSFNKHHENTGDASNPENAVGQFRPVSQTTTNTDIVALVSSTKQPRSKKYIGKKAKKDVKSNRPNGDGSNRGAGLAQKSSVLNAKHLRQTTGSQSATHGNVVCQAPLKKIDENGGAASNAEDTAVQAPASSQQPAQRNSEHSLQIMVPDQLVGLIIGRGGETIQNIRQLSKCHVSIAGEETSVNGLRPVNLPGSCEAGTKARDLIMEIVESYGESTANKKRGWVQFSFNKHLENSDDASKTEKSIQQLGLASDTILDTTTVAPLTEIAEVYGMIDESGMGSGVQPPASQEVVAQARANSHEAAARYGECSTQFMVPDRLVGVIIGRGGRTIQGLRERTRCSINILGDQKSVNGFRPVNLTGSRNATAKAYALIMEIVEHHSEETANKEHIPVQPSFNKYPNNDIIKFVPPTHKLS